MKKKYLVSLILLFSILIFTTSLAYAGSGHVLGFYSSLITQAKSNWCYAATAENAIKIECNPSRNQWDAVNELKGSWFDSYPNISGSISDSESASEYISDYTEFYGSTKSAFSFGFLVNEIEINNGIELAAGYYYGSSRNGGHIVLMIGYDTSDGDDIIYFDPWDGTYNTCLYSSFCDGDYNGRKYDQTAYNNE